MLGKRQQLLRFDYLEFNIKQHVDECHEAIEYQENTMIEYNGQQPDYLCSIQEYGWGRWHEGYGGSFISQLYHRNFIGIIAYNFVNLSGMLLLAAVLREM